MAKNVSNSYEITSSNDLFLDPTFSKKTKFNDYFPVKFQTINSSKFDNLSMSSRVLLLHILHLNYKHSSPIIHVNDADLPTFRRRLVVDLFSELSNFGYLQASKIKQKEIKQDNIKGNFDEKKETSKHWFYKFIVETLCSLDLGLLNYLPKVEKAFVSEQGFNEWVDLLTLAQNFQKADLKHQQKYFIKALKDELKNRGCL